MKSTYTDAEYTALPFSAQAHAHCVQIIAPPIIDKEVPVQQIMDWRSTSSSKKKRQQPSQGGGAASIPIKFEEVTYPSVSLVSMVSKDDL